ncbi:hypothetical protein [Okeania sp.]|uniref:hypothetical protein n=1 Tax=Okeania sp. TaxID=3100323 RepID=UPI002B4B5A7E|nr:hypothetical protein [Okeania sp.]MEB3343006.1 hypothetical protein [Okeania sp.]
MVQYSLNVTKKNTNQKYRYTVDLGQYYEDQPTIFFTPIVCNKIKNELEKQSNCKINEIQLQGIIKTWIEDIKEGYRDSSIMLDLPTVNYQNIHNLTDLENQTISSVIDSDLSDIEPKIGALPPLNFC